MIISRPTMSTNAVAIRVKSFAGIFRTSRQRIYNKPRAIAPSNTRTIGDWKDWAMFCWMIMLSVVYTKRLSINDAKEGAPHGVGIEQNIHSINSRRQIQERHFPGAIGKLLWIDANLFRARALIE